MKDISNEVFIIQCAITIGHGLHADLLGDTDEGDDTCC